MKFLHSCLPYCLYHKVCLRCHLLYDFFFFSPYQVKRQNFQFIFGRIRLKSASILKVGSGYGIKKDHIRNPGTVQVHTCTAQNTWQHRTLRILVSTKNTYRFLNDNMPVPQQVTTVSHSNSDR